VVKKIETGKLKRMSEIPRQLRQKDLKWMVITTQTKNIANMAKSESLIRTAMRSSKNVSNINLSIPKPLSVLSTFQSSSIRSLTQ